MLASAAFEWMLSQHAVLRATETISAVHSGEMEYITVYADSARNAYLM
jgi:hypothetical protein